MTLPHGVRRVIVVILDGIRADAIHLFPLPNLARLADQGASTFTARTVTPSVTAAAMTSLFTGVSPDVHGLAHDRFSMPKARARLTPVTRVLQRVGMPSSAHIAAIPHAYRALARRIARSLGLERVTCSGSDAGGILSAAHESLSRQRRGLILLHWPDADRAGHAHGWNSTAYAHSARQLDDTLGVLEQRYDIQHDPHTLVILCADHGGGGLDPRDHNSLHPLDQRIPIILLGGGVRRGPLLPQCSLLDIPATICWILGATPPASYTGRPLTQAFIGPDAESPRMVAAVA
ncbi:MAG: alkaline phosphatase family protein [Gemmatimonadota bacterium]